METTPKLLNIGLAIGQGTGPELAEVFEKVVNQLARLFNIQVKLHRSSRVYHTYHSLFLGGNDLQRIRNESTQDATHYENFCKEQAAQGTKFIFRTAFTAQSLYLVRQNLQAVKVELFHKHSAEILLIRDQAQGFYTGSNSYFLQSSTVSRTCHFDKVLFGRIVAYAIARAHHCWGDGTKIDNLRMVYKHHLFDGIFDTSAQELSQEHGLHIQFIQPDTMNRNILAFGVQGRQLIIASNEYADIMEVLFLDLFSQGVQETSYSENVYLAPATNGLVEYQTVHGSADDLTDKGIVNPSATLQAAASILERHGLCKGVELAMERIIGRLLQQKVCTPDQGGTATTAACVSIVLQNLADLHRRPVTISSVDRLLPTSPTEGNPTLRTHLPTLGLKTSLLVIDFQKDFAASINASSPTVSTLIENISTLLAHVRSAQCQRHGSASPVLMTTASLIEDIEIIHIRFLGDLAQQSGPWASRNKVYNRRDNCVPGSEGAKFIEPIKPQCSERIIDKRCLFDPFMVPEFETYLKGRGIQHLILVGLYGDVCVDATARSGFQRGYWISIVDGCVGNLYSPVKGWMEFARRVYRARMLSVEEFKPFERVANSKAAGGKVLKAKLA